MSDPIAFYRTAVTNVSALINDLDNMRIMSDMIATDSTLVGEAAAAAAKGGRSDLLAQDFTNLKAAIDQILFTFNSGTPPQKQYFYKFL